MVSSSAPTSPHTGPIAGRYRLQRQVAAGGMGTVWLAIDEKLGREVAVKIMAHGLSGHAELLARFEREAKAVAQLRSTHVVEVYDYGVSDHVPFMVMELLDGESLRTRLRRVGRLGLRDVAIITDQIAKGLKAAHTAGLVHRDLKPSNVFIARRDDVEIVKLLDFGVVKSVDSGGSTDMTASGTLLGTPQYMSPEQVRARRQVDSRSDLWSLGVIVFRMLTGINPFRGESVGDAALRICSDELPRVRDYCDDLPEELDRFCARAFARDPAARFQTADELSAAFRAICAQSLSGLAIPAPQIPAQAPGTLERSGAHPVPTMPGLQAAGAQRPAGASATPPPVVREAPTPISISGIARMSGPASPSATPPSTPRAAMPLPPARPPPAVHAHGAAKPASQPTSAAAAAGHEAHSSGPGAPARVGAPPIAVGGRQPQFVGAAASVEESTTSQSDRTGVTPTSLMSMPEPAPTAPRNARARSAAQGAPAPGADATPAPLDRSLSSGTGASAAVLATTPVPLAGAAGSGSLSGSIPGTNIPRPYLEPPTPVSTELGMRHVVLSELLALKRKVLRSPMVLIVGSIGTVLLGGMLAIVLLSPDDKAPGGGPPATHVDGRFLNPAWLRVRISDGSDSSRTEPKASSGPGPAAPPSSTPSAASSSAPSASGTAKAADTSSPDKRGKTGSGKTKPRPTWF